MDWDARAHVFPPRVEGQGEGVEGAHLPHRAHLRRDEIQRELQHALSTELKTSVTVEVVETFTVRLELHLYEAIHFHFE